MSLPEPDRAEPFTPLAGDAAGDVFSCPLCGGRFTHGGRACGGCPLARGCEIVRCPHCGYGFPRESRLVSWLRRLAGRRA